jgi:biopolymer transport protein ExbD
MRTEVINYLKTQNLGSIAVSSDLPFDDSGVPLYTKNAKKVYVDNRQITTDPLVQTLGGVNILNESHSVDIFFAVDAKTLITNYDTVVNTIRTVKDNVTLNGAHTRTADVATEYVNDLLITQITITLTKIA